jgi:hypothetical protein
VLELVKNHPGMTDGMTETLLLEVADPYKQLHRLIMKKEVSSFSGMTRRRVPSFSA